MDPKSKIRELLEDLRAAFISRGVDVDSTLRPGLTREEILEKTASLDFPFPEELIELYTWRDGTEDDSHLFIFRDNPFISLERALLEQAPVFWRPKAGNPGRPGRAIWQPRPISLPFGSGLLAIRGDILALRLGYPSDQTEDLDPSDWVFRWSG